MKKENSHWILVYAKANMEKWAKENLNNQGFETFLPMIAKKNNHQSKSISVEAMFPRYLFTKINFDSDNWISIRSTKGVSHPVLFGRKHAIVQDQIITLLKSKVDENEIYHPKFFTSKYREGEELIIKRGSFAGMKAIFLSETSKDRVRLLLELLKSSITLDISKHDMGEKELVEIFKV